MLYTFEISHDLLFTCHYNLRVRTLAPINNEHLYPLLGHAALDNLSIWPTSSELLCKDTIGIVQGFEFDAYTLFCSTCCLLEMG
jgi:hypothetical protein